MKKLYWRPNRVSRIELLFIASLALSGMVAVENFPAVQKRQHYTEKIAASQLALRAMLELKQERERRKIPISEQGDPAKSGMIGDLLSPIASNSGHLPSKQTSVNPNFAAVVVHQLRRADVDKGDWVAVGVSGSFPALNVATYAALETIGAKPVVIASAAASQWGATHPRFTWLDMEGSLNKRRVFTTHSIAASLGGIDDRALGLSSAGKAMLAQAIERAGIPIIAPVNYEESVALRMKLYEGRAGLEAYKAYINVGGGTASVGTRIGKKMFQPGLNRRTPLGDVPDSVMLRFSQAGIPIIHLSNVVELAQRYGLPEAPHSMPAVGQGKVFVTVQYNLWLAGGVLFAIAAVAILFLRLHLGVRLSSAMAASRKRSGPVEMV